MKEYHKNAVIMKLSFVGCVGGGNPLRAWALACFSIVKFFIDCVLTCFDILIPPYEALLSIKGTKNVVYNFFPNWGGEFYGIVFSSYTEDVSCFDKSNIMIYAYHMNSINLK